MKVNNTKLKECKLIDLPKITGDRKGSITFVYGDSHIPFEIARLYYLYDVPGGAERAGHAHKELKQIIMSVSGSFDIILDDGKKKKKINLSRPYYGLYLPNFIWRELVNFSSGSVCLVLASLPFDENDYIYDYDLFLKYKKAI